MFVLPRQTKMFVSPRQTKMFGAAGWIVLLLAGLLPFRVQELSESRGGRPGRLPVLMSLMVSVDVKQHWTMLTRWSQFVPNVSTQHPRILSSTSSSLLPFSHRSKTQKFSVWNSSSSIDCVSVATAVWLCSLHWLKHKFLSTRVAPHLQVPQHLILNSHWVVGHLFWSVQKWSELGYRYPKVTYLSTHTVYQYKIQFLHYFRGIWPYWKMDTGKQLSWDFVFVLNWAKILKNCQTSSQWMPSPNAHWLA